MGINFFVKSGALAEESAADGDCASCFLEPEIGNGISRIHLGDRGGPPTGRSRDIRARDGKSHLASREAEDILDDAAR